MDFKEENGEGYWRIRGADTWNPFKSGESEVQLSEYTFGLYNYKFGIANSWSQYDLSTIPNYQNLVIGTNCFVIIQSVHLAHSGGQYPTFSYNNSTGILTIYANNPSASSGDGHCGNITVYVLNNMVVNAKDKYSILSISGVYSGTIREYKCYRNTWISFAMWGNIFGGNSGISSYAYININNTPILSYSGTASFNNFITMELLEGDTISIGLATGGSNVGAAISMIYNGSIY